MEVAYNGLIDKEGLAIVTLAAKITQLVFVRAAKDGWTEELRALFERLSQAYGIRVEEYFGPGGRPLTHEIAFHALDDLLRHGSLDAFLCWPMERFIKKLGSFTLNGKEIEITMTTKVLLGRVSTYLFTRREEKKLEDAGLESGDKLWQKTRE